MRVIRLLPNEDLKIKLSEFAKSGSFASSCILTCVGSLRIARIRLANAKAETELTGPFEIVSLVGTLTRDGLHLHIALADSKGQMIGGHVQDGCLIYTTAEIVIGEIKGHQLSRRFDSSTGFNELFIESSEAL